MIPREMWLFSDLQYGFRCSGSTADLLTVIALDISKTFNKVWYADLWSYGISGQIFGLISSFLSNR